jgi:hypothetical protein
MTTSPQQKLIDLGWQTPDGRELTWQFWQSQRSWPDAKPKPLRRGEKFRRAPWATTSNWY